MSGSVPIRAKGWMYFTIRQNARGRFWWQAVADKDHEMLVASQPLHSKEACERAIAIIKAEAAKAPIYDNTT